MGRVLAAPLLTRQGQGRRRLVHISIHWKLAETLAEALALWQPAMDQKAQHQWAAKQPARTPELLAHKFSKIFTFVRSAVQIRQVVCGIGHL